MKYQTDTKLALLRTLIQIEMADGDGKILPALREAEAILEDGHNHAGGGSGPEAVGAVTRGQAERPNTVGDSPRKAAGPDAPDLYQRVGAAAIPLAQDSPGDPPTHRVIVRHEVGPGGVSRAIYAEHPVGSCANCGGVPR